jgi:antitoxin FitA
MSHPCRSNHRAYQDSTDSNPWFASWGEKNFRVLFNNINAREIAKPFGILCRHRDRKTLEDLLPNMHHATAGDCGKGVCLRGHVRRSIVEFHEVLAIDSVQAFVDASFQRNRGDGEKQREYDEAFHSFCPFFFAGLHCPAEAVVSRNRLKLNTTYTRRKCYKRITLCPCESSATRSFCSRGCVVDKNSRRGAAGRDGLEFTQSACVLVNMPSLQIRDIPDDLYEALASRAKRERRSLAQQAVAELSRIEEVEARGRRQAVIDQLRRSHHNSKRRFSDPVRLVRKERER